MAVAHGRRLDLMDAPTVPLPRPHLAAVGVAAPVDGPPLDGYAQGYADGLARKSMAVVDAKILPMERA
jgi:hypothetical protein